jgi:hypothetical protein
MIIGVVVAAEIFVPTTTPVRRYVHKGTHICRRFILLATLAAKKGSSSSSCLPQREECSTKRQGGGGTEPYIADDRARILCLTIHIAKRSRMMTDYWLQTSLETVETIASTVSDMMGTLVGVSKVVDALRRRLSFLEEVVEGATVIHP